jgi:hypothetical protein
MCSSFSSIFLFGTKLADTPRKELDTKEYSMKRILFILLCLGVLGTSGCYYDPTLAGVSPSVDVGVGDYIDEPSWTYYPYRDGWYFDQPYRWWHHPWHEGHQLWHGEHHRP